VGGDGSYPATLPKVDAATIWAAIEAAAEQAGIGVYVAHVVDRQARILYVNAIATRILGRSAEEIEGKDPMTMLRPPDIAASRTAMARSGAPSPVSLELLIDRPDGTVVEVTLAASRMLTPAGLFSFGYFRDVTHERETLDALRRSEARFRFLVESAPDGVVILQRGLIVFINPKAAQLLGVAKCEDALGQPIAAYLPPSDAALAGSRIMAMMRDNREFPPSEYGVLADPNRVVEIKSIVCEWNGSPAVLAFARDVTERKALERRLVESDRLAALGTLAAGVAHEINNPLTYAQLSAQRIARLVERLDIPAEARTALEQHIEDVHHGIRRVASITHTLRSFVTHEADSQGPVDVAAALERSLKMVDNDLRHAAQLVVDVSSAPPVIGNTSQLEQVFVNVLINAIKALPPNPSTPHEIRVSLVHADDRVVVTIADTGCGIPAPLRARIFDPFFTTRDVGHGMGLGLSVSKTIVEQHGGQIEVESTENVGTTVRIYLRPYDKAEHAKPARAAARPPSDADAGPRLRVLVVDDEPIICAILQRILGEQHEVTIATSGNEALSLLSERSFDVALCDVMMPGMNADELYRRVTETRPEAAKRIAFMTGGALDAAIENVIAALPNRRLAKPFKIDEVLELVASFSPTHPR
jgi:PAS domain S-box-containing protein